MIYNESNSWRCRNPWFCGGGQRTLKISDSGSASYHPTWIYYADANGNIQSSNYDSSLPFPIEISVASDKDTTLIIRSNNRVYPLYNSASKEIAITDNQYIMMYQVSKDTTDFQYSVSCIISGTLITLADGTKKPIENIAYNDNLLVWDFYNGCFSFAKPRWIKIKQTTNVYNKLTFDNGATLGLVGEGGTQGYHRIFNKQAGLFTHTGVLETPDGTITFAEDKSEPVLVSQELVNETVDYYNIITDKHFNLFANGILTSCKCSNMYRIEDMKYVGERLMSDEDINADFAWRESLKLPK